MSQESQGTGWQSPSYGKVSTTKDLVTKTLFGLDFEYITVVVQLAEKAKLTWVELQASLLTFESRLEQLSSVNIFGQPSTNLVSNKPKNVFGPIQVWRGQTNRGRGRNYHGGRSGSGRSNGRPTCQLCVKVGHTTLNCFFRFDQSFTRTTCGN